MYFIDIAAMHGKEALICSAYTNGIWSYSKCFFIVKQEMTTFIHLN